MQHPLSDGVSRMGAGGVHTPSPGFLALPQAYGLSPRSHIFFEIRKSAAPIYLCPAPVPISDTSVIEDGGLERMLKAGHNCFSQRAATNCPSFQIWKGDDCIWSGHGSYRACYGFAFPRIASRLSAMPLPAGYAYLLGDDWGQGGIPSPKAKSPLPRHRANLDAHNFHMRQE